MVFEKIKKILSGRKRDPFDTQGLEGFSRTEQERILGKIGAKESELLKRKADIIAERRIEILERKLGIKKEGQKGKSVGERLSSIKAHRQRNLARRAERQRQFAKQEEDFKAGRLKIKPVGNVQAAQANIQMRSKINSQVSGQTNAAMIPKKLNIKPIKLKGPSVGMR